MESEQEEDYNPELVAWAKQRMKEMDEEAEAATKALGLPTDRKFDVLRVLYGPRRLADARSFPPRGEVPDNAKRENDGRT